MKKFLILILSLMLIGGIGGLAMAEPEVIAEVPAVVEPAPEEVAPLPFGFDFAVSGDIFYLIGSEGDEDTEARAGEFVEGVSLKIANLYGDLVSLNVVAADMLSDDRSTLVGAGATVNLPTLIKQVFQGEWVANLINPSVGVVALVDLNNKADIIPALHLQVIRYDF